MNRFEERLRSPETRDWRRNAIAMDELPQRWVCTKNLRLPGWGVI